MSDLKFNVGDEVAVITSGWGAQIDGPFKVEKVYKNGNFVLEGQSQQWRQSGHHAGRNWTHAHAEIWSTEHRDRQLRQSLETTASQTLDDLRSRVKTLTSATLEAVVEVGREACEERQEEK